MGNGGKCGSTAIDRNFDAWMVQTFGDAYRTLNQKKRGPGSSFMGSFEEAKKSFGEEDSDMAGKVTEIEILDLLMDIEADKAVKGKCRYDPEQSTLYITR